MFLSPDLQRELRVGPRAWLRLELSRGIYCVAYRLPGSADNVYAGRTPTPADYDDARADPVGVAAGLICDMVNGDKSRPPLPGGRAGLPMGA